VIITQARQTVERWLTKTTTVRCPFTTVHSETLKPDSKSTSKTE